MYNFLVHYFPYGRNSNERPGHVLIKAKDRDNAKLKAMEVLTNIGYCCTDFEYTIQLDLKTLSK